MLYIIRNVVVVGNNKNAATIHAKATSNVPHIHFFFGWPMGVIVPEKGNSKPTPSSKLHEN